MINPAKFIISSDFDAVANSTDYSASVTVSGTVAASTGTGGATFFSTTITTVENYPTLQPYVRSSLASTEYYVGFRTAFERTGSTPTLPTAPYTLYPLIYNSGANTVIVGGLITNPYSEVLTLQSETLTFSLRGFIPPYAEPASSGQFATGTIQLENRDYSSGITLPKYKTFAVGSLHFVLTQSVFVPAYTGLASSPTPGVATCPAQAVQTGTDSNIANGTYMQIRGFEAQAASPNDWRAYASGAFSGGS